MMKTNGLIGFAVVMLAACGRTGADPAVPANGEGGQRFYEFDFDITIYDAMVRAYNQDSLGISETFGYERNFDSEGSLQIRHVLYAGDDGFFLDEPQDHYISCTPPKMDAIYTKIIEKLTPSHATNISDYHPYNMDNEWAHCVIELDLSLQGGDFYTVSTQHYKDLTKLILADSK